MSHNHSQGTDTKAAFMGLIGGALLIGAILYGIVILTNQHFANEKAAGKHGASNSAPLRVLG